MKRLAWLVGALLLLEALLRLGPGPWRPFADLAALPTVSAPDAELGWANRQAVIDWPGVGLVDLSDGCRGSCEGPVHWYGGSWVFGFGLPDDAVVSAALGHGNHAVPGYGTVQSWLAWRRERHDRVIYGLTELHDARNAGAWSWLRALDRARRGQAWVQVPWAGWQGGALVLQPPAPYRHWALSEHSALVDGIERSRDYWHDRWLRTEQTEATVQLIGRWAEEVSGGGGRLVVALLDAPQDGATYLARLTELGVEVHDLREQGGRLPDGHPDASAHSAWAEHFRGSIAP